MISDILHDAIRDIQEQLQLKSGMYDDPDTEDKIANALNAMTDCLHHLDMPPAAATKKTTITTTTKPTGSFRNWLEVGHYEIDDFGDAIWRPSPDRYPHKDSRLTVQRKYDGRGKAQEIRWIIDVPANYPLSILCKSGDNRCDDVVLWQPGRAAA